MSAAGSATIDWQVPDTGLDAVHGDGATRAEKTLPSLTGLAGAAILVGYAATTGSWHWSWWQYLVAAILAFDLVGGVVANALNSAKRFQHADHIAAPRPAAAFVRNHVLFTAVHVHPIVVAWLFGGAGIWWGVLWYAVALGSVIAVPRLPLYLQRPAAMAVVALAPVLAGVLPHPGGFAWLPAVLVAKLTLAAVREEPYRPVGTRVG